MVSLIGAPEKWKDGMHCETASTSRQGDRDYNQDRYGVARRDSTVMLLLADGLGGSTHGELAAQAFIDSMLEQFSESTLPLTNPPDFLVQSIEHAHHDVVAAGRQQQLTSESLTTGVACLLQDQVACWAHVGDSRLYLLRDQRIVLRTEDHSMVEEMIQRGELEESERETSPLRNFVTRVLGGKTGPPEVSVSSEIPVLPGDVLLLCSDGLWSALPEICLFDLCSTAALKQTVQELASQAEQASTPCSDNITLTVLRVLED